MKSSFFLGLILISIGAFAQSDSLLREKKMDSLKTINAEYNRAIRQADSIFRRSDFLSAKQFYRKASNLKPMEQYPKDQIKVIDGMAICYDKPFFMNAIKTADSLFLQRQFAEAKLKYQEALALKPAEYYPKDQIAKCDQELRGIQLEQRYNHHIKTADSLFMAKEYHQAKIWYQEASRVNPIEQYPKDQMVKCDEFLKED